MRALLVVDIDHRDGWSPIRVERDRDKQAVRAAIVKKLHETRRINGIIVFVVFPFDVDSRDGFSGQEYQTPGSVRPTIASTKQLRWWRRIFSKRMAPSAATDADCNQCLACDIVGDKSRLAEFLEHRCLNPQEPTFTKAQVDAFTNKRLAPYLRLREVDETVLAGCFTFGCVEATAVGAVGEKFNVTLLSDCVYPPFSKDLSPELWLRGVRKRVPRNAPLSVQII